MVFEVLIFVLPLLLIAVADDAEERGAGRPSVFISPLLTEGDSAGSDDNDDDDNDDKDGFASGGRGEGGEDDEVCCSKPERARLSWLENACDRRWVLTLYTLSRSSGLLSYLAHASSTVPVVVVVVVAVVVVAVVVVVTAAAAGGGVGGGGLPAGCTSVCDPLYTGAYCARR